MESPKVCIRRHKNRARGVKEIKEEGRGRRGKGGVWWCFVGFG